MRRLNLIIIIIFSALLANFATAGEYTLTDGQSLSGEPISFTDVGLIVKSSDGQIQPRVPWAKFSQDSLKQLFAEAKSPRDKGYIEPLLEDVQQEKVKRKEIVIKPVERPERLTTHIGIFAALSSPVGMLIFFILYLANLYAAYEIAIYRYHVVPMVCGISAAAPVIGPIIFLCIKPKAVIQGEAMSSHVTETDMSIPTGAPVLDSAESNPLAPPPGVHSGMHLADEPAQPVRPVLPEPIIFRRGEFLFNRRFFETKLAGFLRVNPGEAERDLVVYVKSARGDFAGRRVTQITPNELSLQVFKDNVTADEVIPFIEIQEVQIRHQDSF